MNVDDIDKNLKLINFNGVTLNIEEKLNLQLSFA
jgi:filamentous hemagglutinin family protein